MTGYVKEILEQRRPVSGAFIGMAVGMAMVPYVQAVMGPYLIKALGWSKSDFALTGLIALGATLVFPFVGRLADNIGARRTAMIGVICSPPLFVAYSQLNDFKSYLLIYLLQCLLTVGTTAPIYCRLIVQHVHRARGLALALAASGPGVVGMAVSPMLNAVVSAYGWRVGYLALASITAIAGLVAMWLLPADNPTARTDRPKRNWRRDFAILVRMRAFWIIVISMFFCNIPLVVFLTQLGFILAENGISLATASLMISAYAAGMLGGRLVSGLALDRFSPPLVTTVGLSLSAVGIFIMASPFDAPILIWVAVLLVGFSNGSESDIVGFLVARNFGVSVYSTVFGTSSAAFSIGSAVGALLLGIVLARRGEYAPFLFISGFAVLGGSMLFLFLPKNPDVPDFDSAP